MELNLNFDPFPVLRTERLTLGQLSMNDAPEIFIQRSHPTIQKFIAREPAKSLLDAKDWITKILGFITSGDSINWTIAPHGQTKLIGNICLWNINKEQHMAELGYDLHPDYFGKGLMNEAVAKVVEFGFEQMKLSRIDAYTHKDNLASRKLLERNGFKRNYEFESTYEDQEELLYNTIYTRLAAGAN